MDALKSISSLFDLNEKLLDWSFSFLKSELDAINGVKDELDKLRRTSLRISALLEDSEQRRIISDESVKLWLRDLKSVHFDSDDLLDRHQTNLRIASAVPSRKRKRSSLLRHLDPNHLLFNPRNLAGEVRRINERLDEISKSRKNLQLKPSDGKKKMGESSKSEIDLSIGIAGSFHGSEIVGRDEERRRIARMLRSDDFRGLTVIPIFGAPGIGKSTLARLSVDDVDDSAWWGGSDDGEIDEKPFFSMKIWVWLPRICDLVSALRAVVEEITKEKCELTSLEILRAKLKDLLAGSRFLIVLDNAWAEDDYFWEVMWSVLQQGEAGSKVVITCRSKGVWNNAATYGNRNVLLDPISLEGLDDDECETLLFKWAFGRNSAADVNSQSLKRIGKQIAISCQGSPLAAKTLGAILYHESDEEGWKTILDEMGTLQDQENRILSSLIISYHHLPYHLKQCFAYCSVFPNDYEFDKVEVVRLWIAEGLIHPIRQRRLEAIGERCFEDLARRSFFEKRDNKYKMPGLIHDLARVVSKYETLIVESCPSNGEPMSNYEPIEARYASLVLRNDDSAAFDKLYRLTKLRALKLYSGFSVCLKQVPAEVCKKLSCLRVLDCRYTEVKELPDSVGKLIHLRYLGLANTKVEKLPESLGDLYNLQVLDLRDCYKLKELPKKTSDLVNLRHLDLHLDWDKVEDIESMPTGIGNLTSLQTLSRFTITPGCKIAELKNLKPRGELCITKLENIDDPAEAEEAYLHTKDDIDSLMLKWTSGLQSVQHVNDIAEKLRPSTSLNFLRIENYPGKRFPDWLGHPSLSNLQKLLLTCCRKCESFPAVGQLPMLRDLRVERMHGVKSIGRAIGFPSLEILTLDNMFGLQSLFDDGDDIPIPKLRRLSVMHCPKLEKLRNLPPELEHLAVKNCLKLSSISPLVFLKHLYVESSDSSLIDLIERSRSPLDPASGSTCSEFVVSFFLSTS